MTRGLHVCRHLVLGLIACGFLFPISLVISTSLKPLAEIDSGSIFSLPHAPTLAAWHKAWTTACIGLECHGIAPAFANSIIIVIPSLLLSVGIGAIAGYALSLRASVYGDFLFSALLFGLFIPAQVTLFPMIHLTSRLGLFGTIPGVVLAHVIWGLPFVTLMMRNTFLSVPRNIVQSARVDGAGFVTIFWRLMIPMSWPMCIATIVLQFTYLWNDFLFGLIIAGHGQQPVTVTLSILAGAQYGLQEYNVNMAAAMIAAAPTIVIYLASGRLFLRWLGNTPTELQR